MPRSLLPIVASADNFPYLPHRSKWQQQGVPPTPEVYIPFHLTAKDQEEGLPPIGLIRPDVLQHLRSRAGTGSEPFKILVDSHEAERGICFHDWVGDQGQMGQVMNDVAVRWRDEGKFPGPLGGKSVVLEKNESYHQAGGTSIIPYLPTGDHQFSPHDLLMNHSRMPHLRLNELPVLCSD